MCHKNYAVYVLSILLAGAVYNILKYKITEYNVTDIHIEWWSCSKHNNNDALVYNTGLEIWPLYTIIFHTSWEILIETYLICQAYQILLILSLEVIMLWWTYRWICTVMLEINFCACMVACLYIPLHVYDACYKNISVSLGFFDSSKWATQWSW